MHVLFAEHYFMIHIWYKYLHWPVSLTKILVNGKCQVKKKCVKIIYKREKRICREKKKYTKEKNMLFAELDHWSRPI